MSDSSLAAAAHEERKLCAPLRPLHVCQQSIGAAASSALSAVGARRLRGGCAPHGMGSPAGGMELHCRPQLHSWRQLRSRPQLQSTGTSNHVVRLLLPQHLGGVADCTSTTVWQGGRAGGRGVNNMAGQQPLSAFRHPGTAAQMCTLLHVQPTPGDHALLAHADCCHACPAKFSVSQYAPASCMLTCTFSSRIFLISPERLSDSSTCGQVGGI